MSQPTDFISIVRRHLGPPVNIEGIVRSLGIGLDKKAQLDEEIAGQVERLPDGSFEISANAKDHYFRRRFTIAHELGHFMLHSHLIGQGVDDTKAYRSEPTGKFYNESIESRHETEANQFAASILMPQSAVLQHAIAGTSIQDLAKLFQVSPQAMSIRLDTLGVRHAGGRVVGV